MKENFTNLGILPYDTYINKNNDNLNNEKFNNLIEDISILNWIEKQFKLEKEQRDFKIQFKKFTAKEMIDFNNSIFEKENIGKWYNYVFSLTSGDNIDFKKLKYSFDNEDNNLLLSNDYNFKKSLYIFWRLIANNLDSSTTFKISFKVLFKINIDKQVISSDNANPSNSYRGYVPGSRSKDILLIRTISPIQIFKNTDFNECYEIFVRYIEVMSESYIDFEIKSIIFPFCINKDDSILKEKIISEPEINDIMSNKNIEKVKIKLKSHIKDLPTTANLYEWGKLKIESGSYPFSYKTKKETSKVLIKLKNKQNNYIVLIRGTIINGKGYILNKVTVVDKKYLNPIHEFIDIIEKSSNLNSFTRLINNQLIVYKNNEIVYNQNRHKSTYFTALNKCESISTNFITMDLETKNINGNLEPYCICIFDGTKSYSFYITDFTSSEEMVKSALKFLMQRKYNKNIIYLHNFSYFDGIFLFRMLADLVPSKNIKPLMRDSRIINLKIEYLTEKKGNKETKYYINFRDSYLLLTASLSKLGKTFSSNKINKEEKWFFPFNFVNEEHVKYNYIGDVPDIKYFEGIDKETYNKYLEFTKNKNKSLNNWNLKDETIYYCEQDCRTLYFVIKEFSKEIFKLFNISISKTPTISSLAFRIFRSSFIKDNTKIAVINNELYDFLYKGFYGGAVDAYIPTGEDIKCYDVNSLYPSSMFNNPMPIGNPYYFEGDIKYFKNYALPTETYLNSKSDKNKRKNNTITDFVINIFNLVNYSEFKSSINLFLNLDNNNGVLCNENKLPYGFFEVNIKTPSKDEWNEPILLKRHKTRFGGYRTIAPVGKWKGVYFSEELYNAINKNSNHKYKIERGILFRSDYIFKEYVEKLYELKEKSDKESSLYAISKLLLNSLFGRFGMKPNIDQFLIYDPNEDNSEIDQLYLEQKVDIIAVFDGEKELLSFRDKRPNSELVNLIDDNLTNASNLFINVSISSAITGYSRNSMSYFKNNPLFKLYYTDTDSAFINVDLESIDKSLIGSNLGQLKLETTYKRALFLGAKLYGGITNLNKIIMKIKGINIRKNPITYDQLESLIKKGQILELPNEKWYRNLGAGKIEIKQEIYKLTLNSTKRVLIYDQSGKLIKTEPIEINEVDNFS